jgi:hypothetical protein
MNDIIYEIHKKNLSPVKVVEVHVDSDRARDAVVAMLEGQGKRVSEASEFVGTDGQTYILVKRPPIQASFEHLTPEEIALAKQGGRVQRSATIQPRLVFRVESQNPLRVVELSRWSSDILPAALKKGFEL